MEGPDEKTNKALRLARRMLIRQRRILAEVSRFQDDVTKPLSARHTRSYDRAISQISEALDEADPTHHQRKDKSK